MRLRKLFMCLLAAVVVSGGTAVNTKAAESNTVISAPEEETKEESTNNTAEGTPDGETAPVPETAEGTETKEEKKEAEAEPEKEELEEEEEDEKPKAPKKKTAKEKKISYTKAELRLLACLISCEAGSEPYAGKLAVGIVVVNRKESSRFPDSIKNVVYQKYQFGPARNGSLKKALARYDGGRFTSSNDKDCIKAAKEALSGTKSVTYKGKEINMKGFLFFSGKVSGAKLTIGNHQFK